MAEEASLGRGVEVNSLTGDRSSSPSDLDSISVGAVFLAAAALFTSLDLCKNLELSALVASR